MANLRGGSDMGPWEGVYQRVPAVGQGILQLADCTPLSHSGTPDNYLQIGGNGALHPPARSGMRGVLYLSVDRMKVTKWAGAAVAGAMMVAAPGTAGAVVVLDQLSQVTVPANPGGFYVGFSGYYDPTIFGPGTFSVSHFSSAQSITAGTKGKLDHIDFSHFLNSSNIGWSSGTLVVSLIDGDYASGARTIIGQSTFDLSVLGSINTDANLLNFTFQTSAFHYNVKNGQQFSVLLDTDASTNGFALFHGGYGYTDPTTGSLTNYIPNYSGGKLVYNVDGNVIPRPDGVDDDLTFATYVDTSGGVPEPATWALMIFGFGGIGAALRRRGKRVSALA